MGSSAAIQKGLETLGLELTKQMQSMSSEKVIPIPFFPSKFKAQIYFFSYLHQTVLYYQFSSCIYSEIWGNWGFSWTTLPESSQALQLEKYCSIVLKLWSLDQQQELVKNANLHATPQTYCIRNSGTHKRKVSGITNIILLGTGT